MPRISKSWKAFLQFADLIPLFILIIIKWISRFIVSKMEVRFQMISYWSAFQQCEMPSFLLGLTKKRPFSLYSFGAFKQKEFKKFHFNSIKQEWEAAFEFFFFSFSFSFWWHFPSNETKMKRLAQIFPFPSNQYFPQRWKDWHKFFISKA